MECSRVLRPLRIATIAFFALTCGLLIVLWARSYRVEDRASGHYSNSTGVRFYSSRGWLVCSKNTNQKYPWALELGSKYWLQPGDSRLQFSIPSDFFRGASFASISIPHSCLLVGFAAMAAQIVSLQPALASHRHDARRNRTRPLGRIATPIGRQRVKNQTPARYHWLPSPERSCRKNPRRAFRLQPMLRQSLRLP